MKMQGSTFTDTSLDGPEKKSEKIIPQVLQTESELSQLYPW